MLIQAHIWHWQADMGWRSNMLTGSFRKVPFHTRQSEAQIGRRTVLNEYPGRDKPYVEDLGRKARSFTLTVFVVGQNYMAQRDALERAFEQPGPGELIHPWRGSMRVSVTECRATETIDEGGKQSWTVTFTESGENSQPNIRPDTYALVDAAANHASTINQAEFSNQFTVKKKPAFVQLDAISKINQSLDDLMAQAKSILPDMSILPAYISAVNSTVAKLTSLIFLPSDLATAINIQIAAILGLASGPEAAINALSRLFSFGDNEVSINALTPSRTQQATNRKAINQLIKRAAMIEAARASSSLIYKSLDQAEQTRDLIIDAIEAETLDVSDALFDALSELRVAVIRDINTRSVDLSKVVSYTPKSTLPALVIAYGLYGDASLDVEIVERNHIVHPGFVPGGKALEVLTDD